MKDLGNVSWCATPSPPNSCSYLHQNPKPLHVSERERERERAGEQWLVGDAKADRRVAAKAHHSGKTVLVALWRAERKWAPNGSERGEEGDSDDHLAILALATGWCRSEGPETKKENR